MLGHAAMARGVETTKRSPCAQHTTEQAEMRAMCLGVSSGHTMGWIEIHCWLSIESDIEHS
jgi:hypothetical protein